MRFSIQLFVVTVAVLAMCARLAAAQNDDNAVTNTLDAETCECDECSTANANRGSAKFCRCCARAFEPACRDACSRSAYSTGYCAASGFGDEHCTDSVVIDNGVDDGTTSTCPSGREVAQKCRARCIAKAANDGDDDDDGGEVVACDCDDDGVVFVECTSSNELVSAIQAVDDVEDERPVLFWSLIAVVVAAIVLIVAGILAMWGLMVDDGSSDPPPPPPQPAPPVVVQPEPRYYSRRSRGSRGSRRDRRYR